ncbi:6511_t:CDS:2, partial [Gigaspora rosea]
GMSKGSNFNKCEGVISKIWKHNLACLVLAKMNEMQLYLKPDQKEWGLAEKDQRIASVLGKRFTLGCAKILRDQNLFYIQQLLDIQKRRMLTWQQFRVNKRQSCKGRKAKWYMILEKEILKETVNREVKEEFKAGPRPMRSKTDNQKKKRKGPTKHWVQESQEVLVVKRCEGYNCNERKKHQACEEWVKRSRSKRKKVKSKNMVKLLQCVEEKQEVGIELIKNQRLSLVLEELIFRKYKKNRLEDRENLVFFTDGSL